MQEFKSSFQGHVQQAEETNAVKECIYLQTQQSLPQNGQFWLEESVPRPNKRDVKIKHSERTAKRSHACQRPQQSFFLIKLQNQKMPNSSKQVHAICVL